MVYYFGLYIHRKTKYRETSTQPHPLHRLTHAHPDMHAVNTYDPFFLQSSL